MTRKILIIIIIVILVLLFFAFTRNSQEAPEQDHLFLVQAVLENEKISFRDDGFEIAVIDAATVIFETGEVLRGINGRNYQGEYLIVEPKAFKDGLHIRFLATLMEACGTAGNCNWVEISLDIEERRVSSFGNIIFGTPGEYYLSPNAQKIAVVSTTAIGTCIRNHHIFILSSGEHGFYEIIRERNIDFYADILESLIWEDDENLYFSTVNYYCDDLNDPSEEKIRYEFHHNAFSRITIVENK